MATIVSPRSAPRVRAAQAEVPAIPHRVRRVAAIAAAIILAVALVSYVGSMTGRSNTALGVRSVEWLRDNGAASIVAQVETWYYELNAPSKGGHIKALPKVGVAATPAATRTAAPSRDGRARDGRSAVAPMIHPALPGEGVWHATRSGLGPAPPLMVTTLRNEPDYPQVVVALAWIDTRRTQTLLYTGLLEPAVALPTRGPMEVPTARRDHLLATFNSGFKLVDSARRLHAPRAHLQAAAWTGSRPSSATATARVNIVAWSHGAAAPPSVLYARQNLPLIVDHGRPNPSLNTGAQWGATVGNAILVWRSGIGIDKHGNLIYAAGNDQTVMSLAAALIRAGAVRAMELDINSYWVSFITYGALGRARAGQPAADMDRSPTRYLTPGRPRLLRGVPAHATRCAEPRAARAAFSRGGGGSAPRRRTATRRRSAMISPPAIADASSRAREPRPAPWSSQAGVAARRARERARQLDEVARARAGRSRRARR